jgi:hypothetical protein
MMRFKRRSAILACVTGAAIAAAALPAGASAGKAWVSTATPSAPFNSCAHPAFDSIQDALAGSATTIEVCGGTYAEQLHVERAVSIVGNGATLKLPAAPQKSETACDAASEAGDGLEDQDLVSVCTGSKVKINGLTIDAIWPGSPVGPEVSCGFNLYGVLVAGGASLQLTESTVDGAAPATINGCQYGVGVQIGASYASPAQVGSAKLTADVIEGYQKNGITVDGAGSDAKIADVGVIGAGKTAEIAQNGIGVQLGAKASISAATVKRNECENATCGGDPLTDFQAEGVYFFGAAAGSSIKSSDLTENDAGVEAFDTAASEPTSSQVSIDTSTITANRYEDVLLNQGFATVNGDTISDSRVGVEAIQIAEGAFAQTYGPKGSLSGDTFSGLTEWAVAGDSDNAPGDLPGSISVKKSAVSGNPGPTVEGSLHTNNAAKLPITTKSDT